MVLVLVLVLVLVKRLRMALEWAPFGLGFARLQLGALRLGPSASTCRRRYGQSSSAPTRPQNELSTLRFEL